MKNTIEFSKNLIKGKIGEIIFERMFTEAGEFTILESGYEYTLPELAQYQQLPEVEKYIENVRKIPDFILISDDRKRAFIVEVKYRTLRDGEKIFKIACDNLKVWNPSWLFVASPDGFFFSPCNAIKKNKGKIGRLPESWINKEIQDKYLKLMNEFRPETKDSIN